MINLGKKLIAFAHYDFQNRTRLMNLRPVYGVDLRKAIKVNLLLTADIHDSKRHNYVDRLSKFKNGQVRECFSVPSAVFNSFALIQKTHTEEGYEAPMCKVLDFPEKVD